MIEKALELKISEEQNFFNGIYRREDNCEEKYKGLVWNETDSETRIHFAKDRARLHNRLYKKDNDIVNQNILYLNNIFQLADSNNIGITIIIPPFTIEYENLILPSMKNCLLEELEKTQVKVDFYDMNELVNTGVFDESDFFDMDHLNDRGANKFTEIMKQLELP